MLQLDSLQVKAITGFNDTTMERRPLGHLCFNLVSRNDELPHAEDLVDCLLEVDKSVDAIGDALFGCLDVCYDNRNSEDEAKIGRKSRLTYWIVEKLLMVLPSTGIRMVITCYIGPVRIICPPNCASMSSSWYWLSTRMPCRKSQCTASCLPIVVREDANQGSWILFWIYTLQQRV